MDRLKRRADFRAAAAGIRATGNGFVLQTRRRVDEDGARIGFTVSRQVGNAVERNRVRRRLRELVRLTSPQSLRGGHDYVLVGRRAALQLPFRDLVREFDKALVRVHAREGEGTGGTPQWPLHEAGSSAGGTRSRAGLRRTQPSEH